MNKLSSRGMERTAQAAEFTVRVRPGWTELLIHGDHVVARAEGDLYDELFNAAVEALGGRVDDEWAQAVEGETPEGPVTALLREAEGGMRTARGSWVQLGLDLETDGERVAVDVFSRLNAILEGFLSQLKGMDRDMEDVANLAGEIVDLSRQKYEPGKDYYGTDYLSQIGFYRDMEDIASTNDPWELGSKLWILEKKLASAARSLRQEGGG